MRACRAPASTRRPLQSLNVADGDTVRVAQGDASAVVTLQIDATLPDGVVRVATAHAATAALGPMFGPVTLERA